MTTEHTPIIDTAALIADEEHYERIKNIEEHLHPKGQCGASGIPKCDYLVALKTSGITLPKIDPTSVKGRKGALQEGNDLHGVKQDRLIRHCRRVALEQGYLYEPEVYKPLLISNKDGNPIITVVSPIDNYFGKPNEDGEITTSQVIDFKNFPMSKPVIAKGSIPIQIGDIKTMGGYAFKLLKEGKMSFAYDCQFHIYMGMTDLKEIWIYAIEKETGENLYHHYAWSQVIWDEMVKILERKQELITLFEALLFKYPDIQWENIIPPQPEHLACLQLEHDNIDFWSCECSTTEEYMNTYTKRITQRLTLPCKAAQTYMKQLYQERFPVGSLWKRRNDDPLKWGTTVVILKNDEGVLYMQRWYISKAQGYYKQWAWGRDDVFYTDDPVKAWVGLRPVKIKCVHEECPRGYPQCAYTMNLLRNCPEHQIEIVK